MVETTKTNPSRFDGAAALVTGASRGLGLAVARRLAERGAKLCISARDGAALDRAAADLRDRGAEVVAVPCDLTEDGAAAELLAEAEERYGALDLLVNNAGLIQVGPLSVMHEAEFRQAMELMYFAPLRLVLQTIPSMRGRGGTIVNITSIGGRTAAPHLLPYVGAKFALTGLSEGLRAELAETGISVTTVVPGLMRTGSHLGADFRGHTPREYAWFAAAAAMPLLSISAERAAEKVVRAAERRRPEVVLGAMAQVATRVHGVAPATTTRALTTAARLLDAWAEPKDGSEHAEPGARAARRLDSRLLGVLTTLNDKAARRLDNADAGAR
ncbi:MAG TPA: SDR family oxidoreductase [Actinospica sp.]|jgi:short-subunit dehydrogenase|nr:SDR family oxidoreductase [Actinospica sp.]